MKEPVLVTGGFGFIGSWVVKALVDKGVRVVVLDAHVPKKRRDYLEDVYPKIEAVEEVDISNYSTVEEAFKRHEIGSCFHLAAQAIVGKANASPIGTFKANIEGTWNVLEAARNSEIVEGLVVASSDKAYGDQDILPYEESFALNALHPYDASKACADILARTYYNTYGLPVAVTRCANIYGGGDLNFSRIVPDTIRSVLNGQDPVIRSDGTPIRDYLYVKDAASGYLKLMENLKNVKGGAFNFGTGNPISVLELVNRIINISGKDLEPKILGKGKTKGEIDKQYLSSEKANKLLGWRPSYDLDTGLKETIGWYRRYLGS